MATANETKKGLTADERKVLVAALDLLESSLERRANAKGVDDEVKAIYDRQAANAANLRNRLKSGELDL